METTSQDEVPIISVEHTAQYVLIKGQLSDGRIAYWFGCGPTSRHRAQRAFQRLQHGLQRNGAGS
jgi:hypothetical protein